MAHAPARGGGRFVAPIVGGVLVTLMAVAGLVLLGPDDEPSRVGGLAASTPAPVAAPTTNVAFARASAPPGPPAKRAPGLYVADLGAGSDRRWARDIDGPVNWSTSGRSLLALSTRTDPGRYVWVTAADRRSAGDRIVDGADAVWRSPDGTREVEARLGWDSGSRTTLRLREAGGGKIAGFGRVFGEPGVSWNVDGSTLALKLQRDLGGDVCEILFVRARTGEMFGSHHDDGCRLTTSRHSLAPQGDALLTQSSSPNRLYVVEAATGVARRLPTDKRETISPDVSWCADGTMVFAGGYGFRNAIVRLERSGREIERYDLPGLASDPRCSPDSRSVAYIGRGSTGKRGWQNYVVLLDLATGRRRRVTHRHRRTIGAPALSPDGRRLAYVIYPDAH